MFKASQVKQGSTVKVVPLGKLAEIHYNDKGIIGGVFDTDGSKCLDKWDASICIALQKNKVIPSRLVSVSNVAVRGVFIYEASNVSYVQRYGVNNEVLAAIETSEIRNVKFLAFNLENAGVQRSVKQNESTLSIAGFDVCPSFVVSAQLKDSSMYKLKAMEEYPFVSGYAVFESVTNATFVPSEIEIFKVQSVEYDANKSGYIDAFISSTDGKEYIVPYSNVVKHNIQTGSIVIYDEGIKYCSDASSRSKKVSNEIKCKFCNATLKVPSAGFLRCSYGNCLSNLYTAVEHMCEVFSLQCISHDEYVALAKQGSIRTICDAFDAIAGSNVVECSAADVLDAVCPPGVVRSRDFFDKLVQFSSCIEALTYYLEYPEFLSKDMSKRLNPIDCKMFSEWIAQAENLLNVKFFFNDSRVHVKSSSCSLTNVPALFRNKLIYLEGDVFSHGSYSYVADMLKVYGADIAADFDNRCNCVVVSSLVQNAELKQSVKKAQCYNIPVFSEAAFFSEYGIDSDIQLNS